MKKETAIIILTALLFASLVFVTWAEIAVSTWIVGHSGVEDLMERDGKHLLLFLKDAFWFLGRGLLLAEVILGGILLWMLRSRVHCTPKRDVVTDLAEPGAAPNGGPATPVGNSEVTKGPPSAT